MSVRPLSKQIQLELARIPSDRIIVAAVIPVTDLDPGALQSIGLRRDGGTFAAADPTPPSRERGLHARRNLDGWQERHTELPKEDRDISHWAPSWRGSGTHLVSRTIKAHPVETHSARMLTVSATILHELSGGALVRLRVDQPLDRTSPDFSECLQFNLSLLREVCGQSHVYDADMTDEAYAKVQRVDWELLPPGSLEIIIAGVRANSAANPDRAKVAEERLRVLDRLKPDGFIQGSGKFSSYFGARFGQQLVALENLEYGNALYLFEADWERLSQLSRTEVVKRRDHGVHRVPHMPGWQSVIRKLIQSLAARV